MVIFDENPMINICMKDAFGCAMYVFLKSSGQRKIYVTDMMEIARKVSEELRKKGYDIREYFEDEKIEQFNSACKPYGTYYPRKSFIKASKELNENNVIEKLNIDKNLPKETIGILDELAKKEKKNYVKDEGIEM